ncbi:MAG: hypothetical protein HKM00_00045 [Gallionella sp.]|jgi:hypothetical protein|nr:hypothetical protein [Gallionella sp.]
MKADAINLDFSSIEVTGDGYIKTALLNGVEWKTFMWEYDFRSLIRDVPAGGARISECSNDRFMVKIEVQPSSERAAIEKCAFFDTLNKAAEFAESFVWEIKEQGGYKWYQIDNRDEYRSWIAVVGEGNTAVLSCYGNNEFHIKRNFWPRPGESYEINASRYDSCENKHAVRTFEEAAAIAITLPSFLAVLGSMK